MLDCLVPTRNSERIARCVFHHSGICRWFKHNSESFVRCVADTTKEYGTKKCPPTEDGHNPRSGQETQNPVRCAASDTPSAITHIGCVYADELSIKTQCERVMIHIKGVPLCAGTFSDGTGHVA